MKIFKCIWRDQLSAEQSQQGNMTLRALNYEDALERTLKYASRFGVVNPKIEITELQSTPKINQKNALGALKL